MMKNITADTTTTTAAWIAAYKDACHAWDAYKGTQTATALTTWRAAYEVAAHAFVAWADSIKPSKAESRAAQVVAELDELQEAA